MGSNRDSSYTKYNKGKRKHQQQQQQQQPQQLSEKTVRTAAKYAYLWMKDALHQWEQVASSSRYHSVFKNIRMSSPRQQRSEREKLQELAEWMKLPSTLTDTDIDIDTDSDSMLSGRSSTANMR